MGGKYSSNKIQTQQQFLDFINLKNLSTYINYHRSVPQDLLNKCSIIGPDDIDRKKYSNIFQKMKKTNNFDPKELQLENLQVERCIASLLGLGICDALGASTQFLYYTKQGHSIIKQGFKDVVEAIECGLLEPRSGRVGIWTDDCSMALCMATSILYNKGQFVPIHIRYLFILWIINGFNNGGRQHSIGLGGNIKISMDEFMSNPSDFCRKGDCFNNGNGSLMRLAPISIYYRKNIQDALYKSLLSSRTTHNGLQAQECCRLLSFILIKLYQRKKESNPKQVLNQACNQFIAECQSVHYLSRSQQQPESVYDQSCLKYGKKFKMFNRSVKDRNWNWKDKNFDYSNTRFEDKPGYVGSYCMDALSMALHTVWITNSFKEVAILNANLGGDCDTVGATAGQIAGAMYGIDQEMLKLYSQMVDYNSGRYELFLHGYKLAKI